MAFGRRFILCSLGGLLVLSCTTSRMLHPTIDHYTKQRPQVLYTAIIDTFSGSNLRLSLCIISVRLSIQLAYSCIFHPCIFTRIAFSTPAWIDALALAVAVSGKYIWMEVGGYEKSQRWRLCKCTWEWRSAGDDARNDGYERCQRYRWGVPCSVFTLVHQRLSTSCGGVTAD